MDVDGFHHVALLDGENDVHAAGDFAEDGVARCALLAVRMNGTRNIAPCMY